MTYQLATAKVWNGTAWVAAAGGSQPWWAANGWAYLNRGVATVAPGAVAHTKGAYVELVASTAANADLIAVNVSVGANATNTATLLDIAIGAAGSETVIVGNVAVGSWLGISAYFPVKVPAGSRVSVRSQAIYPNTRTAGVGVTILDSGKYADAPSSLDVLGTSTATSAGTQMSASANTYVQVIASTARQYSAIQLLPSANSGTLGGLVHEFTVGTGAAGSEVAQGTVIAQTNATEQMTYGWQLLNTFPGPFAAGIRIAVKESQSSPGGSTYAACVVGIPA